MATDTATDMTMTTTTTMTLPPPLANIGPLALSSPTIRALCNTQDGPPVETVPPPCRPSPSTTSSLSMSSSVSRKAKSVKGAAVVTQPLLWSEHGDKGAYNYGLGAQDVSRKRHRVNVEREPPTTTMRFAHAVVNEALSRGCVDGPARAASTLAVVFAGTIESQARKDLGLSNPGGFEGKGNVGGAILAQSSQALFQILDAVGPTDPVDYVDVVDPLDSVDVGFQTWVDREMRAWKELLVDDAPPKRSTSPNAPPSTSVVAATVVATACAWAAAMRGHPSARGMATQHWRDCGKANAYLVAVGAFGVLEEPTAHLHTAWSTHGLAHAFAREAWRDVARVVAHTLAPIFAEGVAKCGDKEVLHMATRAAALVVATSEYLATRTEPILIMLSAPTVTQTPSSRRKHPIDEYASLPAIEGFASRVVAMCSDLSTHPTRHDVAKWARMAHSDLSSSLECNVTAASTEREGMVFNRLSLCDLCTAILSNPTRGPQHDAGLARWHGLARQTVSRLRISRPPTRREEARLPRCRLIDERCEARLITSEGAHRSKSAPRKAQEGWTEALGESWRALFERYANALSAVNRFAVGLEDESEEDEGRRRDEHTAASDDADSILGGNESTTRVWSVANAAYAAMRYTAFGDVPFSLASAPPDTSSTREEQMAP